MKFLASLDVEHGVAHSLHRDTLFDDVMNLFETQLHILEKEFPFRVKFVGERAVDTGGVTRDMFSAFYEECYLKLCDGGTLLTPVVHPHIQMSQLATFGSIISYAYITSGFLPIRIAFPCLAAILLGPVQIPDKILTESFVDSLSVHDAGVFRSALTIGTGKTFPPTVEADLMKILGLFGCRQIPRPDSLKRIIIDVSRYNFLLKPAAAIATIHSGVPSKHCSFWSQRSVGGLHDIYTALAVSTERVLGMIDEPIYANPNQERVVTYLRQFVGGMNQDELRAFVRFVTGASVCMTQSISIIFNALDGFARRPIGHSCSSTLELPSTYKTFPEFVSEFRSVISDSHDNYNWVMDAV